MNNTNISVGGDFKNSGIFNSGEILGSVTNVVGDIVNADATEKIAEIIASLQEAAKMLPKEQRDGVESALEDLQAELEKLPEEQQPKEIRHYLKRFVAAAAAVLVGMGVASEQIKTISANAVDIVGNTAAIAEEVQRIRSNSTEFKVLSPSDQEVIEKIGVFSDKLGQITKAYKLQAD